MAWRCRWSERETVSVSTFVFFTFISSETGAWKVPHIPLAVLLLLLIRLRDTYTHATRGLGLTYKRPKKAELDTMRYDLLHETIRYGTNS